MGHMQKWLQDILLLFVLLCLVCCAFPVALNPMLCQSVYKFLTTFVSAVEPTAPPQNARVLHVENDTLLIRWDPPSRQHRNGLLLGYRVSTTFDIYSVTPSIISYAAHLAWSTK